MSNIKTKYQSRWGHHPCRYELYAKLKLLHAQYWQTIYDFHRWHRWSRKEPQNRVGPEPEFCAAFVRDQVWYKPFQSRGVDGCKVYPKTVTDHGVVDLYHQARRPQPDPVDPFDANTLERIEALYAKVTESMK